VWGACAELLDVGGTCAELLAVGRGHALSSEFTGGGGSGM
jgi:hypothetical protein